MASVVGKEGKVRDSVAPEPVESAEPAAGRPGSGQREPMERVSVARAARVRAWGRTGPLAPARAAQAGSRAGLELQARHVRSALDRVPVPRSTACVDRAGQPELKPVRGQVHAWRAARPGSDAGGFRAGTRGPGDPAPEVAAPRWRSP